MTEFAELVEYYLRRESRTPSWLAKQLKVSPSTVGRWLNEGSRPHKPEIVLQIADILRIDDVEERQALLIAAGYGVPDREIIILQSPDTSTTATDMNELSGEASRTLPFAALNRFFGWDKAPDHWRVSRAGMTLYSLSQVVSYITPQRVMVLLAWLIIWLIANQLVGPIHQWPLDDHGLRQMACFRFGIGGIFIPLLIAAVTSPDRLLDYNLNRRNAHLKVFVLKFVGAVVSFYLFVMLTLVGNLFWFYLSRTSLSSLAIALLLWIPLLMGYVGAKRIPYDRFRLHKNTSPVLATDWLFLGVFTLMAPATSLFIYFNHTLLAHRLFGPFIFISAIGAAVWLMHRQQHPLSDDDS